MINAILNNIAKRNLRSIDITTYDAEKCFDKLFAKECFNDMVDNGFKNDELPLLFKENMNAKVAVKTSRGTTKAMNISEVIMQGTVWGSLCCTVTMDKLGKQVYSMPELLYQYKGVGVPPLGMVDDIITVTNVDKTEEMNNLVNTFIEHKNLRLSKEKCFRIHIGKGHENCPVLQVHGEPMKETEQEKYLGDVIHKNGSIQATIESRVKKGDGIIAEILSLINEVPLGKYKTEVGLKLRDAMLLNGILYNSEAWHGMTSAQVVKLQQIDEALLRGILKAHAKTPQEFLYLETGATPIKYILAQRRINYLRHIISRSDNELIKKVFIAQKENPTRGDFIRLVEKDIAMLGITYEEVLFGQI